jgi:hypothetical protein
MDVEGVDKREKQFLMTAEDERRQKPALGIERPRSYQPS